MKKNTYDHISVQYVEDYSSLLIHSSLLRDEIRVRSFNRAISSLIKPGDKVLDVGCGSGILSLLAARAGASRVYAVDNTRIIDLAHEFLKDNGVTDRVTLICGDMLDVKLPEKVDVIVSEGLGVIGVNDSPFIPLLAARDRWLKKGGTIIPASITTWAAPISSMRALNEIEYFKKNKYGIDYSAISKKLTDKIINFYGRISRNDSVANPQPAWKVDLHNYKSNLPLKPFKANLVFTATSRNTVSAICAWFSTDLGGSVTLTNSPLEKPTHWGCAILPLRKPFSVKKGDKIHVKFIYEHIGAEFCNTRWSVKLGSGGWEHHDYSKSAMQYVE